MDDSNFNFDANMLSDFDFTDFTDFEAPNQPQLGQNDGFFSTTFSSAAPDIDPSAQQAPDLVAQPITPWLEGHQDPAPTGDIDPPTTTGYAPCVWCEVPHGQQHLPDCALLLPGPPASTGEGVGGVEKTPTPAPRPEQYQFTAHGLGNGGDVFSAPAPSVMMPSPMQTQQRALLPVTFPGSNYWSAPPPAIPYTSPYPQELPVQAPVWPQYPGPGQYDSPQPASSGQPTSPDEDFPPQYQSLFTSFEAARQSLIPSQGIDRLVPLNLEHDDWVLVKGCLIHSSAGNLFEALRAQPGAPPANFTDDQTAYYYEHQDAVLMSVNNKINSDPAKTEARIMMLLEEIINIHEHGVPTSVWQRTDVKSGYILETDLTCSERVREVIKAVDHDKYIAVDVLSGHGTADLARSPARYLRRKHENCRVNARKAFDKKQALAEKAKKASARPVKMEKDRTAPSSQTPAPALPFGQYPINPAMQLKYAQTQAAQQGQKRKADFPVAELLKRFKYKEADQE